ncbi:MAG: class I SAM-dependent methyltransferase [Elusimicrobia bacterium]|nr:class I SAM-dependent methyltransferase [Elusimicrobiota bacterium]
MGFSKEWDDRYRENTQMSIWPWSDLVSYVRRYAAPKGASFKVLELGCGAGANIPFFRHLGVDYYAIEGSEFIVRKLWEAFPDYKARIVTGDFTAEIPFEGSFDLIVDRSSLTHATTSGIKNALKMILARLNPGGKFIGIDWFSTQHSDSRKGTHQEDEYTRFGIAEGQFAGVGCVHFSDKKHIVDLFSGFRIRVMEHKVVRKEIPHDEHVFASWNFVAVKEAA